MCWTTGKPPPWPRACRETTDFNTGDNEGVGYFRVNQRKGWRMNTARAFLRTRTGQGLQVETHAQTRRVLIEDGRATASNTCKADRSRPPARAPR